MFGDIIGNEEVKATLVRLKTSGRIPNAMIFGGPDGVGKRLFALEIARSLVCRSDAEKPCGECSACVRVGEFEFPKADDKDAFKKVILSRHADVGMVIAYNRNILVDAIRDLENEAHYRPYEAEARIFIIDDADKMNDAASNALLKTLEEPASTTHIFLITSRPDTLLPTIRSRAQMLRFSSVGADRIERFLMEEREFSASEAKVAARLSRGSIGQAVSTNVGQFRARRERMLSVLTSAIDHGDRVAMLRTAEEMNDAKNKDAFEENLGILESLIHDVWSIAIGRDRSTVANFDIVDKLAALAENARISELPEWLTAIQTLRENLIVNLNKKIATDALFMGIAA